MTHTGFDVQYFIPLVNCILLRLLLVFAKGRGTCGSGERNIKIWIEFRKSPRFSHTSPLSQVALFLLCVVSPVFGYICICWKRPCWCIDVYKAKKKNMCVYGHPTHPIFQPPTLTFLISNYSTLIFANDPINFYTEFG